MDLKVPNLPSFSNVAASLLLTPTDAFAFRIFGNPVSLKYFPESVKTLGSLLMDRKELNLRC